jgi:hypothetical protein
VLDFMSRNSDILQNLQQFAALDSKSAPEIFDLRNLPVPPDSDLGRVLSELYKALVVKNNLANWRVACGMVRAEEASFPRTGPDLGILHTMTNNSRPKQKSWKAARRDYFARMRPDGVFAAEIIPTFRLAAMTGRPDFLLPFARLAFKLSLYKEAINGAKIFMARQNASQHIKDTVKGI